MTAMPQMVALYNGLGGLASALVATSEYLRRIEVLTPFLTTVMLLSLFVGSLTFTGSAVAYAKLQELFSGRPVVFPLQHLLNLLLVACAVGMAVMVFRPEGLITRALIDRLRHGRAQRDDVMGEAG